MKVESHDGLYALAEQVEREVLVGRMNGIALQAEAHQNGLYAQHALEVADDGDAAPPAHG